MHLCIFVPNVVWCLGLSEVQVLHLVVDNGLSKGGNEEGKLGRAAAGNPAALQHSAAGALLGAQPASGPAEVVL